VYTWGSNEYGVLGNGTTQDGMLPRPVEALKKESMLQLICGGHHIHCWADNGEAFGWGLNSFGQCASEKEVQAVTIPLKIMRLSRMVVRMVACGEEHSVVVTDEGEVFTWGRNHYGQLGNSDLSVIECRLPQLLAAFQNKNVMQVACGAHCTFFICSSGEVWACGRNEHGSLACRSGTVRQAAPLSIRALSNLGVKQIFVGACHGLALTNTGGLVSWGSNMYGQLGLGNQYPTSGIPPVTDPGGGLPTPRRPDSANTIDPKKFSVCAAFFFLSCFLCSSFPSLP